MALTTARCELDCLAVVYIPEGPQSLANEAWISESRPLHVLSKAGRTFQWAAAGSSSQTADEALFFSSHTTQ